MTCILAQGEDRTCDPADSGHGTLNTDSTLQTQVLTVFRCRDPEGGSSINPPLTPLSLEDGDL
ncbi:hypothetical protein J6590_026472 [Homalodisca vitripennis]|nr:hypothetical protein J6590_026472 [Homalodisca vitripennis]